MKKIAFITFTRKTLMSIPSTISFKVTKLVKFLAKFGFSQEKHVLSYCLLFLAGRLSMALLDKDARISLKRRKSKKSKAEREAAAKKKKNSEERKVGSVVRPCRSIRRLRAVPMPL